jgi:hypothetical protein
MQAVLVKIPLGSNKEVHEHPAEMLAELGEIVYLDGRGKLTVLWEVIVDVHRGACPTEPCWKVWSVADEQKTCERSKTIVKDWKSPFY